MSYSYWFDNDAALLQPKSQLGSAYALFFQLFCYKKKVDPNPEKMHQMSLHIDKWKIK